MTAATLHPLFYIRYPTIANLVHAVDESEGYLRPPSPQKLPGQALALSMSKVWEVIHHNKDLNLPAHRVMVANIRCSEIAKEISSSFASSVLWVKLASEAEEDLVPGFGDTAGKLLAEAIENYTEEARYFDQSVSQTQQHILMDELIGMIRPVFDMQLTLARGIALESYQSCMAAWMESRSSNDAGKEQRADTDQETFVERAARCAASSLAEFERISDDVLLTGATEQWSAAAAREALQRNISAHQAKLQQEHVEHATMSAISTAETDVSVGASPLFESSPADLWTRLTRIVDKAIQHAVHALTHSLHGYGVPPPREASLAERVAVAAKSCLQSHAREAANTALPRIKDRFSESFHKDDQDMPRTWTASVDIPAVASDARGAAAALLAQLCVTRLGSSGDEGGQPSEAVIDRALSKMAADQDHTKDGNGIDEDFDLLSAAAWPGIPPEDVLLTPAQVRTIWRQFTSDSALSVQQAVATQQANKLAQNRMPPVWAIVAMVLLGFNEFIAVLKNPLYLVLVIFVVAFAKTVYQELDVEGEMQKGLLPGVMTLSAKFMPTVQSVARRTFESGRAFLSESGGAESSSSVSRSSSNATGNDSMQRAGGFDGEGLRSRRREGVEMTSLDGQHGEGLLVNNRKDD